MKRFLMLVILLVATSVSAQYPSELRGIQIDTPPSLTPLSIEVHMLADITPWGDLDGEFKDPTPSVMYIGDFSILKDGVEFNLIWVGHECGELLDNTPCDLQWMKFTWDEDMGCYTKVLSQTGTKTVLHTLTFHEGDEFDATWRSLILIRNQYFPYAWVIDHSAYREGQVTRPKIHLFNHAVILQTDQCKESAK